MKFTDEEIKKAIKGTGGIRTAILEALNSGRKPEDQITTQGLKQRIEENEELQEAVEAERDSFDDVAERKFKEALDKGEKWAVNAWLRYRGRNRGYVERQEHTGKDGKDLPETKQQIIYVPVGDYAKISQQETNEKADKEFPISE